MFLNHDDDARGPGRPSLRLVAVLAAAGLLAFGLIRMLGSEDASPTLGPAAVDPETLTSRAEGIEGIPEPQPTPTASGPAPEPDEPPVEGDVEVLDEAPGPQPAPSAATPDVPAPVPVDRPALVPAEEPPATGVTRPVDPGALPESDYGLVWPSVVSKSVVGLPFSPVNSEARRRGKQGPWNTYLAWPRQNVEMHAYGIDRYEVTNAQYERFLVQDALVRYVNRRTDYRGDTKIPTLIRLVRYLVRFDVPQGRPYHEWDALGWRVAARQLYETNRARLHAKYPRRLRYDRKTKQLDEEATYHEFLHGTLPEGFELRFFTRLPPMDWHASVPAPGTEMHPVRGLSQREAAAYALWAGKALPTELEWEFAARGPVGHLYPWGPGVPTPQLAAGGWVRPIEEGEPLPEPSTVPVRRLAAGQSWCGCMHMAGNVAEYVRGTLTPWEGWDTTKNPDPRRLPHFASRGVGRFAPLRGGSAEAQDPLAVTAWHRGYPRRTESLRRLSEEEDRDRFEEDPERTYRVPWAGVRAVIYEQPGRAWVENLRANPDEDLASLQLEHGAYACAEMLPWRTAEEAPEDGVYVLDRARGAAYVPARRIDGGEGLAFGTIEPTLERLVAQSQSAVVTLGVVHLHLAPVSEVWSTRKRPDRWREGQPVPSGTWQVVLTKGRVALRRLGPARFGESTELTLRERSRVAQLAILGGEARDRAPADAARSGTRVRRRGTRLAFEARVPYIGPWDGAAWIQLELRLDGDAGWMRSGSWCTHDSGDDRWSCSPFERFATRAGRR